MRDTYSSKWKGFDINTVIIKKYSLITVMLYGYSLILHFMRRKDRLLQTFLETMDSDN